MELGARPRLLPQLAGMCFLTALGLLYRLPNIINPYDYNSDHAVVYLQAKEFLRGDFSFFLWNVGYQSSFDSVVTAIFIALFGDGPMTFIAVAYAAYLLSLFLIFQTLRRHVSLLNAFLA